MSEGFTGIPGVVAPVDDAESRPPEPLGECCDDGRAEERDRRPLEETPHPREPEHDRSEPPQAQAIAANPATAPCADDDGCQPLRDAQVFAAFPESGLDAGAVLFSECRAQSHARALSCIAAAWSPTGADDPSANAAGAKASADAMAAAATIRLVIVIFRSSPGGFTS